VLIDPNLVRQILLKIESASYPLKGRIGVVVVEGYDQSIVDEHIEELRKADALSVAIKRSRTKAGGPIISADVKHLTDTGWRLVDMIKKDDSWARVLAAVGNTPVSIFELVQVMHQVS
jgi:hypothetical protein